MPPSLKIKLKNPAAAKNPESTSSARSNKRKRPEDDDGEGSEGDLLVVPPGVVLGGRSGEGVKEEPKPTKPPITDFTPSPSPEDRASKKRRSGYEEDEDFKPGATRDDDTNIDIERSPTPVPEKKPTRQSSRRVIPTKKAAAKAAHHRNVVLSDDEEADDYKGSPASKPKARSSKAKHKLNAVSSLVARDQRKVVSAEPEPKPEAVAAASQPVAPAPAPAQPATTEAPVTTVNPPALPPKMKFPTIKKKIPNATSSGLGTSPAPEPGKTLESGKDLDLRDPTVYTQLFAAGGRQKAREKDEARRKELDAMREATREARIREAGKPFDMLAHSAAMNRFEQRMKSKNNLPPPSQIGAVFLMLRRFRPDR